MISRKTWILAAGVIAFGLLVGRWIGQSASETAGAEQTVEERERPPRRLESDERSRVPRVGNRSTGKTGFDFEAFEAGALVGQRWVRFPDAESLARFLASIEGRGITVLGSIDALHTLRIGFADKDALAGLLDEAEESGYIFPVNVPDVGGSIQEGALGFGRSLLSWLGMDGDLSGAGAGVKVAVLDTGVGAHSAFSGDVKRSNLIALSDDPSALNGHGTAVASLIASQIGLAPGATLLSYRVADDNGSSDSFTLAQGVIEAANAGADIINISMGSSGNSTILRSAIEYAQAMGILIVASAGNDGASQVAYPAAYDGVISVGAVDANGNHIDFSNSGGVTISAPGLDVISAYPGDQAISFTGTSSSAPIVSGAIAYVMQTQNVSAGQAMEMLLAYSNDSGAPGADSAVGEGYLDVGRIIRSGDATYSDVAVASNYVEGGSGGDTLQVTIENRGNTTIVNAPLQVTTPTGTVSLNVATLPAGKSQTFDLPLSTAGLGDGQEIRIDSSVTLSNGATDLKPSNNRRIDVITSATSP